MEFKLEIDAERCKGCALCVGVCSRGVLSMSDSLNSAGTHFVVVSEDGCAGCLHCALICPDAAIEIEEYKVKRNTVGRARPDNR